MKQYLDLLQLIKDTGNTRGDRTGTGTKSIFGHEMRFDLNDGYPLVTTKKVFTRGIFEENFWFLAGSTNIEALLDKNVHIWDDWALTEDAYEDAQRTPPELAQAFADKLNITLDEAISKLVQADRERLDAETVVNADSEQDDERSKLVGAALLLHDHGISPVKKVKIANKGDLGPVYGEQWRNWKTPDGASIDQIQELLENLQTRPWSRRHVVTAWNPAVLPDESISPQENVKQGKMALASCHCLFQFYVEDYSPQKYAKLLSKLGHFKEAVLLSALDFFPKEEQFALMEKISAELNVPIRRLSCKLTQRSCDVFYGVPFNVAGYAMLTHMIAQVSNMGVGELIWSGGDCHIYSNQWDQVNLQLTRHPLPLSKLWLNPDIKKLEDFTISDVKVIDYQSHAKIDGPSVAV